MAVETEANLAVFKVRDSFQQHFFYYILLCLYRCIAGNPINLEY